MALQDQAPGAVLPPPPLTDTPPSSAQLGITAQQAAAMLPNALPSWSDVGGSIGDVINQLWGPGGRLNPNTIDPARGVPYNTPRQTELGGIIDPTDPLYGLGALGGLTGAYGEVGPIGAKAAAKAVLGARSAGKAALEGAPQAAGDFAAAMGQRVPQAASAAKYAAKVPETAQAADEASNLAVRYIGGAKKWAVVDGETVVDSGFTSNKAAKAALDARTPAPTQDAVNALMGDANATAVTNAVGSIPKDLKSAVRQALRGDGIESLTPDVQTRLSTAAQAALRANGAEINPKNVQSLTDQLIAEAGKVNKISRANGRAATASEVAADAVPSPKLEPSAPLTPPPGPPKEPATLSDRFLSVWNLPKALRASLDLSAPFRQGILLAPGHPGEFFGAFKPMLQAAKDAKFASALDAELRTVDRPGLYLAPIDGALGAREEAFMSNFADKIPGVSASNRAYTTFLNKLRADVYDNTLAGWQSGGRAVTEADTQGLSNVINHFTGRGDLPRNISGATAVLNGAFFSPRFTISRFQSVGDALGVLKNRDSLAARQAATDMVKFVGAGIGILALAKLSGAKVEADPRSSNFGKIQLGSTSVELWGGFQSIARYTAQFITGQSKPVAGAHAGDIIAAKRIDTLVRFATGKLAPTSGAALGVLKGPTADAPEGSIGQDFIGQNFSATDLLNPIPGAAQDSLITPLGWADIANAVQTGGLKGGIVGAASLFGAGVTTIAPQRDGLGRLDDGALPATPVTDAWAKVQAAVPSLGDLQPPDRNIGSGATKIVLDDAETDALRVATGTARATLIGQVVASPAFQSVTPDKQQKLLSGAKLEADRQGQVAFALAAARTAQDDAARVRAAAIGARASTTNAAKMDFFSQLAQAGALTDVVHASLDDMRSQPDPLKAKYEPSVNDYLGGAKLVAQYVQAPAFRVGTPQDWADIAKQGAALRATYQSLLREAAAKSTATKKVSVDQLPDYKTYIKDYTTARTASGRPVSAFITKSGTVDPNLVSLQRLALQKDPLFAHFSDVAKQRDPYAIK